MVQLPTEGYTAVYDPLGRVINGFCLHNQQLRKRQTAVWNVLTHKKVFGCINRTFGLKHH